MSNVNCTNVACVLYSIFFRCLCTHQGLTVESEIPKDGGEEVHDKHAKDGYISNTLHSSLGWALMEEVRHH